MNRIVPANKTNIVIRDAAEKDAPFFENLYFQTRRDEFAVLGWDESQLRMFLRTQFDLQTQGYRMQFPAARISVIESDETPVGRLLTDDAEDAREIRLIDIAVLPEARNRGIGSFVLKTLEDRARRAEKSIGLQVLKTNAAAIRLYERFGFEVVGENDLYLEMRRRDRGEGNLINYSGDKNQVMIDELKHEDFAGQLNTKFRVVGGAAATAEEDVDIELIEVSEPKSGGSQEYFSLYFLGEKDKFLPQKLYELEHETLGRGSIFLVPVGADDKGVSYEAVFNRMKQN